MERVTNNYWDRPINVLGNYHERTRKVLGKYLECIGIITESNGKLPKKGTEKGQERTVDDFGNTKKLHESTKKVVESTRKIPV